MAKNNNLGDFLTSLANKIRSKLGTTDTINPQDFDSKIDDVYDKGCEDEHASLFNNLTNSVYLCYYRPSLVSKLKYNDTANSTDFNYMFGYCASLTTIPLFNTSKGVKFCNMFYRCTNLTTVPLFNTSKGNDFSYMFNLCESLTAIPQFDLSKADQAAYMLNGCSSLITVSISDLSVCRNLSGMFNNCSSLKTVSLPVLTKSEQFTKIFANCPNLENVTFDGSVRILMNTVFFNKSDNLTVESLMSLINAFVNTSSTATYKVTIGATNVAKLTAEQVKIATDKRITLA